MADEQPIYVQGTHSPADFDNVLDNALLSASYSPGDGWIQFLRAQGGIAVPVPKVETAAQYNATPSLCTPAEKYAWNNKVSYTDLFNNLAAQRPFITVNDNSAAEAAGIHNAIYRGKALGGGFTAAQYAAIAAGTFDDMYVGDYWTISGVNWRIAAFDYYLTTGDTECSSHHIVVVPDTSLYTAKMNDSNVTTGGYVGSAMYTTNLDTAKSTINSYFSGHVMSHKLYLCNAVTNGRPSGGAWSAETVVLMTEANVYGTRFFGVANDGTNVPYIYDVDKSQFPLFRHRPDLQTNRQTFWLRDVASAANFAHAYSHGNCTSDGARASHGVRPAFCLY